MATIKSSTSLRTILSQTQVISLLVALIISAISLTLISIYTIDRYSQQSSQVIADSISYRIEAALVFNDIESVKNTINNISQGQQISRIEVINTQERVIAQVDLHHRQADFWLTKALFSSMTEHPVHSDVSHNDQQIGSVKVYGSSQFILDFLSKLILALIVSMLLTFIAIAFFSYRSYHRVMQSFDKVTQIANLIREQRAFNLRMPRDVFYELQQLADTFNALLTELNHWHDRLTIENHALAHQAKHDNLTGLANRNHFKDQLKQFYLNEPEKEVCALLFIDNDNFKQVNDNFGHQAGDFVLIEMAKRLSARLRQSDIVARLGGDEFAVFLPNIKTKSNAIQVANDILAITNNPIQLPSGQTVILQFSIGIALSTQAKTPDMLIKFADSAMYAAKAQTDQSYYMYQD